jgi:hypothetical protein
VTKGDIIGYIDPALYIGGGFISCTSEPHVHMNIWGDIPGIRWPHEDSGLPWEPLPLGEWGWLNPEDFLPALGNPIPMFASFTDAEDYGK